MATKKKKPGEKKKASPAGKRQKSPALANSGKRPPAKEWAEHVCAELKVHYPDAECALVHRNPLELLIATILSAQCTDARVNMVTPVLFQRYPTVQALAEADQAELESIIRSTGFFRNKAKNIKACCRKLVDEFQGEVPRTMEELLSLAGVARKTANVVLGNAFGVPGMVVDTHVGRLSRRLGLSKASDPVKVENDLMKLLPPEEWTLMAHLLISHGRAVCQSRKPDCPNCFFFADCPKVGILPAARPVVPAKRK